MAHIFGREISRKELLEKTGNPEQAFGIRPVEYFSGNANLVKAYDVRTGGGLEFSVNENKCLDIYEMRYRGINLGFLSKAGLHSPYNADQRGLEYRYSQGCGMLYTAGLANVGAACSDDGDGQYYHGMIKNKAAQNVCAKGEWQGDDYKITIAGDIREAAFYGRNLLMHREITAWAGRNRLVINDTIENQDFAEDEIMLLYHVNAGYPLLDEGAEYIAPVKEIEPMSEYSRELLGEYGKMTAPICGADELLYCIRTGKDKNGYSAAALINDRLGIGLYVKYTADTLDYMVEWKSMKAGDYALGLLPSTCRPLGRLEARKKGDTKKIKPFEKMRMQVEIGVLSSQEEIEKFKDYIALMD